ncbi:MAG: hypothetical protein P1U36_04255 [Legionellaceae bacterium]|nr:hypothetical protein [Legionellaceae bacterium]
MPYNAEARMQEYGQILQELELLPTRQAKIELLDDFIWGEKIALAELPTSELLRSAQLKLYGLQNPLPAIQPISLFAQQDHNHDNNNNNNIAADAGELNINL